MPDAVAFPAIRNTISERKLINRWNRNSWKKRKEKTNKSNKKIEIRLRLTQLVCIHLVSNHKGACPMWLVHPRFVKLLLALG